VRLAAQPIIDTSGWNCRQAPSRPWA